METSQKSTETATEMSIHIPATKVCKCCGKEMPLTDFKRNKNTPDGHESICKQCRRDRREQRKLQKLMEGVHSAPQHSKRGIKATLKLSDFTDNMLFAELKRRGYVGTLTYSRTVEI